jgi:DNA adenine methylase
MLSYFGGKLRIGEFIYQFIPTDIKTYVEPFSGAFWIYMNPKHTFSHCEQIIYNDINQFMTNLMRSSQDYEIMLQLFEEVYQPGGFLYCEIDPHESEEAFENWKNHYRNLYYSYNSRQRKTETFLDEYTYGIPNHEAALKYAYLLSSTFNGCFPNVYSGCSPYSKNRKLKVQAYINKLNKKTYQEKLAQINEFHSLDFEEIIQKYDGPDTFMYIDPPYFDEQGKRLDWYGVGDESLFGPSSHERLAKILAKTEGRWALSYYFYKQLVEWFPEDQYTWVTKEFFRSSASFSAKKELKGEELLIMNYDPEVEVKKK